MTNTIKLSRIFLTYRELLFSNKLAIFLLPAGVLLLLLATNFIIFTGFVQFYVAHTISYQELLMLLWHKDTTPQTLLFYFLLYLFIILMITYRYVTKHNTHIQPNVWPVTAFEKTAALWLIALTVLAIQLGSTCLMDWVLKYWITETYASDGMSYMEANGFLYMQASAEGMFKALPLQTMKIAFIFQIGITAVLYPALIFFKKLSIIKCGIALLAIFFGSLYILEQSMRSDDFAYSHAVVGVEITVLSASLFVLFFASLTATFTYKLKEKQL